MYLFIWDRICSSPRQEEVRHKAFLCGNRARAEAHMTSDARYYWRRRHSSNAAPQAPNNKIAPAETGKDLGGRSLDGKES